MCSDHALTIFIQGDGVAHAFEAILKSSQLNVTKNVANVIGSQMSMQSSVFGRLGKQLESNINCKGD